MAQGTHLAMQFREEGERDPSPGGVLSNHERSDTISLDVVDEDLIGCACVGSSNKAVSE